MAHPRHLFRYLFRLIRIQRVFLHHGLDEFLPFPWLSHRLQQLRRWWPASTPAVGTRGARLRQALQELGPIFVKLGQLMSTRRDLIPLDIALELELLQDRVPPFDSVQARAQIEQQLGQPIADIFRVFESVPLASASIAQVHAAEFHDGRQVVVKVIRPQIEAILREDIGLLHCLAWLIERFVPDGKRLRPKAVVLDYERTLFDELDLMREAANSSQLRRNFSDSKLLYVPEVYWDYCRTGVMVMERIFGTPVGQTDSLRQQGINMQRLAERGVEVFFTQVFRDNFFHADMHPGNIFVTGTPEEPYYIGIDCGIVGSLSKADQRYLAENFLAFFNRDYRRVAELHVDSGWVPADTRIEDFESAIRTVCEPIFEKPLKDISYGQLLVRLFQTARRFNMEVQPQLVLLEKTLIYIEGLGRQLYPELDLWKTAKPFLERWMREQLGPGAAWKQIRQQLPYWLEKLPQLPDRIYDRLQPQPAPVRPRWLRLKALGRVSSGWLLLVGLLSLWRPVWQNSTQMAALLMLLAALWLWVLSDSRHSAD